MNTVGILLSANGIVKRICRSGCGDIDAIERGVISKSAIGIQERLDVGELNEKSAILRSKSVDGLIERAYADCAAKAMSQGTSKRLLTKLYKHVIKSVRKSAETEEQKRKAAADADQQTSLAAEDLQKALAKGLPALSLKNAEVVNEAAETIEDRELEKILKDMADEAGDGPETMSKALRKNILRKKLKHKEVEALERAAKELDMGAEKRKDAAGSPDQYLAKLARKLRKIAVKRGKHKAAADADQREGRSGPAQAKKAEKPVAQLKQDERIIVNGKEYIVGYVQQMGGAFDNYSVRTTDGEYFTFGSSDKVEVKSGGAQGRKAGEEAEEMALKALRKNAELMSDFAARQNKTSEALFRGSGIRA